VNRLVSDARQSKFGFASTTVTMAVTIAIVTTVTAG